MAECIRQLPGGGQKVRAMASKQLQGIVLALVLLVLVAVAFVVLAMSRSVPYEQVAEEPVSDDSTVSAPANTTAAPAAIDSASPRPPGVRHPRSLGASHTRVVDKNGRLPVTVRYPES
jgi:Na+-transporting methylmalonyl-CoA/oxaloacetate decarboxylase gamma subunit